MNATACLTITGEALTRIARDLMLSDEPGKAYRLLADGLIGDGGADVARRVLAGELNLIGDSTEGIDVEDADPDEVADYLTDLRYIYGGRVKLDGRWYRPSGVVMALGTADAYAAAEAGCGEGVAGLREFTRKRAEFYANPGDRVEFIAQIDGDRDGRFVVFEPCAEGLFWVRPIVTAQDAVRDALAAGRSLEHLGAGDRSWRPRVQVEQMIRENDVGPEEADELRDLAYIAEDELRAAELRELAAKIRVQAGDDVFDLVLEDGRVVQVPRAPFVHWALARVPGIDRGRLPAWSVASPSGLKMCNDDPYHTDWVLGAGLTIEEGYTENVTGPAWSKAADVQIEEVDRA